MFFLIGLLHNIIILITGQKISSRKFGIQISTDPTIKSNLYHLSKGEALSIAKSRQDLLALKHIEHNVIKKM